MREKLKKIPRALKKQILLRYLSGVLIFILYDILITDLLSILQLQEARKRLL